MDSYQACRKLRTKGLLCERISASIAMYITLVSLIYIISFTAIAPSFYKSSLSRETVTSQGGNLTIACRPEAAPTPDITWTRNGQILGGDGRTTVSMDGTLHITQLTISDQGMYMCKATNINGESQTSTRVYVYGEF